MSVSLLSIEESDRNTRVAGTDCLKLQLKAWDIAAWWVVVMSAQRPPTFAESRELPYLGKIDGAIFRAGESARRAHTGPRQHDGQAVRSLGEGRGRGDKAIGCQCLRFEGWRGFKLELRTGERRFPHVARLEIRDS